MLKLSGTTITLDIDPDTGDTMTDTTARDRASILSLFRDLSTSLLTTDIEEGYGGATTGTMLLRMGQVIRACTVPVDGILPLDFGDCFEAAFNPNWGGGEYWAKHPKENDNHAFMRIMRFAIQQQAIPAGSRETL